MDKKRTVELMAPAGGEDSLSAAIRAGADSVYFGIENLNMRSRASANFAISDLARIAEKCRRCEVRTYLAVNTLIYDNDISVMKEICDKAKEAGISAIIASDISAISYAHSIGIPVHISVQANVSNLESVRFFAKFADVVVLARELTIDQIQNIVDGIENDHIKGPSGELVKVEIFAHGALCVSVSGKCYMSLASYNTSGNRGECFQNCRRKYRVIDEESGEEMVIDNQYVMSPKDICTIRVLDKILDSGVGILKLEGRGRSADYVYTVTKAYREAVDAYLAGDFNSANFAKLEEELASVFNRGFWQGGYYLGEETGAWSGFSGNRATVKKVHIGHVTNYFSKIGVAEVNLKAGGVENGQKVLFTGPTTGAYKMVVSGLRVDEKEVSKAEKGDIISLKVETKVRRNDILYLLIEKREV
jgi:putative protease